MYMNTRQRTKAESAEGVEFGEGLCPLPPKKICNDLMFEMAHFDAYPRYSDVLILSSAVPAWRGVCGGGCALPRKFLTITNKLITIITT